MHVTVYRLLVNPNLKTNPMHRLNPNKLLLSKWTAVQPQHKERHFIVSKLLRSETDVVIACELEAVINHKIYVIDWKQLKDSACWQMGWR